MSDEKNNKRELLEGEEERSFTGTETSRRNLIKYGGIGVLGVGSIGSASGVLTGTSDGRDQIKNKKKHMFRNEDGEVKNKAIKKYVGKLMRYNEKTQEKHIYKLSKQDRHDLKRWAKHQDLRFVGTSKSKNNSGNSTPNGCVGPHFTDWVHWEFDHVKQTKQFDMKAGAYWCTRSPWIKEKADGDTGSVTVINHYD